MIDQFEQCRENQRREGENLQRITNGRRWVVARRSKRIIARYGDDVVCFSERTYAEINADLHKTYGCPPGCPTRRAFARMMAQQQQRCA